MSRSVGDMILYRRQYIGRMVVVGHQQMVLAKYLIDDDGIRYQKRSSHVLTRSKMNEPGRSGVGE